MAKTKHWDDTTKYVVFDTGTGRLPYGITGGIAVVVLDGPDAEEAVDELVAAGCPIVKTEEELMALAKAARGRLVWTLGVSRIELWQDRWGAIWFRSDASPDPIAGAIHLSKYEAIGLAEQLLELSKSSPR